MAATGGYTGNGTLHVHKAPYGASNGTTSAPGFVGIYRGATGDNVYMEYAFTADSPITTQLWQVKGTAMRLPENTSRISFSVSVNQGPLTGAGSSGLFGDLPGVDYVINYPGPDDHFRGFDGPLSNVYAADLSTLNIQSGDEVVYRFSLDDGRRVGLGVALVPEPGTLMLIGLGFLVLHVKRRFG